MLSGYFLFSLEIVVPDRGALFPGESLHSLRSHLVSSQRQKPKTSNQSFTLKLMETVNGPTHGKVRRRRMKDLPANLLNRHLCPPPLPPPPPD